jgi:hypothetical protein
MRNKRFSIQTDKATDCSGIDHLTEYLLYVEDTTFNDDMLFCKPTKRRATAKELFKIVDDFVREKSIKWSDCVQICAVVARVMVGNKGLQALIKPSAPEAIWTHCVIYRGTLAITGLSPELRK